MNLLRKIAATALLGLLACSAANAAPFYRDLVGVTFNDGTTASGYVQFDGAGSILDFSIVTQPGTLSGFTYDTGTSFDFSTPGGAVRFGNTSGLNPHIILSNLGGDFWTDSAASVAIDTSNTSSYECDNCAPFRVVTAGSLDLRSVPEPLSLALLGLGLAGLAFSRGRKFKPAA